MLTLIQDTYPAHPKENHMLNLPPIMERICQLMMSFANQKMRDRTRFYPKGSSFKKLHDALGKDVLPEEYGGKAGPIQLQIGTTSSVWKKIVHSKSIKQLTTSGLSLP